ncbi:hypothetical protein [Streptomyces sp. NPDC012825]|uniref:hypothetical protein n=1 Tax=Streptomyces sp. NPDC012825 TaxID=3364851 RepID=UPI0036CDAF10
MRGPRGTCGSGPEADGTGGIRIDPLDIEPLTVEPRLVVASVERAEERGVDRWEQVPALSSRARKGEPGRENEEPRRLITELETRQES